MILNKNGIISQYFNFIWYPIKQLVGYFVNRWTFIKKNAI